jgi:hypothetical protein
MCRWPVTYQTRGSYSYSEVTALDTQTGCSSRLSGRTLLVLRRGSKLRILEFSALFGKPYLDVLQIDPSGSYGLGKITTCAHHPCLYLNGMSQSCVPSALGVLQRLAQPCSSTL